jgi:hypothetical protein
MHEEFSSPIKEIGFACVQFRRMLVFANGLERISAFLLCLSEQVMKFRLIPWVPVLASEQRASIHGSVFVLA